jgi:hypothetical protein
VDIRVWKVTNHDLFDFNSRQKGDHLSVFASKAIRVFDYPTPSLDRAEDEEVAGLDVITNLA